MTSRTFFSYLKRTLGFVLPLLLLLLGADLLLRRLATRVLPGDGEQAKITQVMAGQLDYPLTIWGASTARVHFDTRVIDSLAHTSSFNMGLDGVSFQQYQGVLRHFIRYSRKARQVVIALHVAELSPRTELRNPDFFYPYMDHPEVGRGLATIVPDVAWKMRYVPAYFLTCYPFKGLMTQESGTGLKGFAPNPRYGDKPDMAHAPRQVDIDPARLQEVREVVRLCRQQGIVPVVCLVPYYKKGQALISNLPQLRAALSSLRQDGAVYMDFLDDPICAREEFFYHNVHMNDRGAALFSKAFAQRLAIAGGALGRR